MAFSAAAMLSGVCSNFSMRAAVSLSIRRKSSDLRLQSTFNWSRSSFHFSEAWISCLRMPWGPALMCSRKDFSCLSSLSSVSCLKQSFAMA